MSERDAGPGAGASARPRTCLDLDLDNTPLHTSEVRMLTRGHGLTYLGQCE